MATLTIRNVPDEVRQKLREAAARKGRSMEAEARAVLAEAVNGVRRKPSTRSIARAIRNMQKMMEKVEGAKGGSLVDEFLAERRAMWGEEE
jgi:plasmid stability protein